MKRGFTLVECMLAGSMLCLLALVLLEGVVVSARISRDNALMLAAEGVAWDAAWKRFNEKYDSLKTDDSREWKELGEEAAPELNKFDTRPKIKVVITSVAEAGWQKDMKVVSVDVEWGPESRRQRLSDFNSDVCVTRGNLSRSP